MSMSLRRWGVPSLILVSGIGLWLLFAGPPTLLGFDTGNAGTVLLVATVWIALYVLASLPRGELDAAVSPGEWKAWVGAAFMALAVGYFLMHLDDFRDGSAWDNPRAAAVGRHLVLMLVAWLVLSRVLASRWQGRVEEDERDREIARQAKGWGRAALTACLLVLAVTLGFSPEDRLGWASHFMLANLMILALMIGSLFECLAAALHYRRDRR